MNNIINLSSRRLVYSWCGQDCTLEFDDEHLTWSKQSAVERSVIKTPLWRIMPEILIDRTVPDSLRRQARFAVNYFIGALIVYFSAIPNFVPLLAPVLAAYSIYNFFAFFRAASKFEGNYFQGSKIITEYGEEIAVIPHYQQLKENRIIFEKALIESVNRDRVRHYEA